MATYRVYLVDDDRFLLDMYAMKFKNAGHDISAFQKPEEALEAVRKGPDPDVLLLDIVMPGMTGFELLEIIRKEKLIPKTKVIVLSNQGTDADLDKARELGSVGYIIKATAIPSEVFSETMKIIEKA